MKVTYVHVNKHYKIHNLFIFSLLFNVHKNIISAKSVESHIKYVYDDVIFCLSVHINDVKAFFIFSAVKICVVKSQRVQCITKKDKLVIFTRCNSKRMLPHGETFFFFTQPSHSQRQLNVEIHASSFNEIIVLLSHTGETTLHGNALVLLSPLIFFYDTICYPQIRR